MFVILRRWGESMDEQKNEGNAAIGQGFADSWKQGPGKRPPLDHPILFCMHCQAVVPHEQE